MTPKEPKPTQIQTEDPKPDTPVLVRQADDSLVLFGPDVDDINLCDDPC